MSAANIVFEVKVAWWVEPYLCAVRFLAGHGLPRPSDALVKTTVLLGIKLSLPT